MSKIAVPINKDSISLTLENAPLYQVFNVDGKTIISITDHELEANLSRQLRSHQVDAVLCGMLQNQTRRDMAVAGVAVFAGVYGNARRAVQHFIENELNCEPDTGRAFFAGHYSPCAHETEI
ncbi:hypothetical protein LN736_06085 [Clostridium sp. WLY-B-L2]|uniref:Dinitrogenase iron-molybdenum cofactor biosynthesis domain-containing protein n=1 Tax=Clostridium aromativorans TaxID=2836848 RepID=A0ABS8N3N9_9CLOT|nr:hypothetical protein [Clostridium aromativorans]MCC9294430.1 hypothetical protein [Clostridium aromativorans]